MATDVMYIGDMVCIENCGACDVDEALRNNCPVAKEEYVRRYGSEPEPEGSNA
ncbi:hypothetical protein FACS1894109_15520 [Spirochaetia bacterium]|nr:hypothetical protein FACS1894109_15520 [Spirochaetia bacterium]